MVGYERTFAVNSPADRPGTDFGISSSPDVTVLGSPQLDDAGLVELVRLVDAAGNEVGTADKATVHTEFTPLHLAFSCHLIDPAGNTLLTRRALSKKTWPGVWTNSFCGHPAPGESFEEAITRRAQQELGIDIDNIELKLQHFQYRAVDVSGIVENEICPVFTATYAGISQIAANPDEVCDFASSSLADLRAAACAAPYAFSPWLLLQLEEDLQY